MYQLFHNIIKNALTFNNGKPVINITASAVSPADHTKYHLNKDRRYTSICVKDNGIGFDQQFADKIFIVHQRLNDKPNVPGTGMGLAICKKIVEGHGGAIFAVGENGKGATFYALLPVP